MKQLLIILAFILPAVVKSQDTIKIPTPVAKTIARELISCDSAKAILTLTKEQLSLTENKVILKDSIIANHIKKEDVYKQVITNQDQKFELQGQWVSELRSQNRKLKAKLTFMQIATTIFVGIISYIYVAK
jgi:CRISPR/Cas system CMR subunit Cmr4 (Cas7 group RAMP superfamily)